MATFRALLILLLSVCTFFTSVSTLAAEPKARVCADLFGKPAAPTFHLFAASHTLSQVVRDNAHDYWFWSKQNADVVFGKTLSYQGYVVGDTHPGNLILGPLRGQIRFYIADVKDAGTAPFILDFARLAISTQAIYRRVDDRYKFPYTLEKIYDAYIDGLEGHEMEPPKDLRDLFETTMTDYEEGPELNYVSKHTAYGRFALKTGKVAPFNIKTTGSSSVAVEQAKRDMTSAIRTATPGAKILDFAVRIRDRGGSKSFARYWVLIRANGKNEIVEFKEIGVPAVAEYQTQKSTLERYKDLMEMFWGKTDASIQPAGVNGRLFLMRPKKVELFAVPYKLKDDDSQKLLLKLSMYDANFIGQMHARQMKSKTYVTALKANREDTLEKVRHFSKDYLDRLETRFEDHP